MLSGKKDILRDFQILLETLLPPEEVVKAKIKFEEITNNYEITIRNRYDIRNDFDNKITLYLDALRVENYSKETINGYSLELNKFKTFINKPPFLISTLDIREYLSLDKTLATGTIAKKLSVIKSFYKWCVDEEIYLTNPANKIKTPKQSKRLPKSYSQAEMEELRESCKNLRERALLEVFYSTGCRLSEVVSMKTKNVDWLNSSINIVGKGNKERTVYLNEKSVYYLKSYLEERLDDDDTCEYLFTTSRRPYRKLNGSSIRTMFKEITKRTTITESAYPHRFRHTMATNAMNMGIDLADLQQLLGHENPGTTLRYASVSEERKKQAHKKYVQ